MIGSLDPPEDIAQARAAYGSRVLLLAEGFRLQYRVLRCAAAVFREVSVLGAPAARPLRRSAGCARFRELGHERYGEGDVARINALCRELDVDLVLPSCGATTRFIAWHREEIRTPCYCGPPLATFDLLDDKARFAALCARLDVPHPRTATFRDVREIVAAVAAGWPRYPFVVKPPGLWGSVGVAKIETLADLRAHRDLGYTPVLAQDFVEGRDVIAFFACRAGRVLGEVIYVKSPHEIRFLERNEIREHASRIIAELAYDGIIGFDIRESPDGAIGFIECNPRFWYNMDLAMVAGRNFIALGLGACPDEAAARLPAVSRPWGLARKLGAPWRLTSTDMALLRHVAQDPLPVAWMAFQRIAGSYGQGTGQQF